MTKPQQPTSCALAECALSNVPSVVTLFPMIPWHIAAVTKRFCCCVWLAGRRFCGNCRSEVENLMKLDTWNSRSYRVNDAKFSLCCWQRGEIWEFSRRPLQTKSYFWKGKFIAFGLFPSNSWTRIRGKSNFNLIWFRGKANHCRSSISGFQSNFHHLKCGATFRGI